VSVITIVIPNRNRKLETVKRSLASLSPQLSKDVSVVLVDYGSEEQYQEALKILVEEFEHMDLICCPTQHQLWQKTRAINIVLKPCQTDYFMVADMDMLFHPEAIHKILTLIKPDEAIYFKVGILSEEESAVDKYFSAYTVNFYTNEEATGITLFPTKLLREIGGFDEFYHGWGAEDTDVHVRLRNAGIPMHFYDEETLLLHQWHPKHYRSVESTFPFHDTLEQINHQYIKLSRKLNKQQANKESSWGVLPQKEDYEALKSPSVEIHCTATESEIKALTFHWTDNANDTVRFMITPHPERNKFKTFAKRILGKKLPNFLTLEEVNKCLLENIILKYRNCPYQYSYNRQQQVIEGTIHLKGKVI